MQPMTRYASVLVSLALLSGCAQTRPLVVTAAELCRDWRHQTVSRHDRLTEETAAQIEAGNKSRPAWGCQYGRNEAAP